MVTANAQRRQPSLIKNNHDRHLCGNPPVPAHAQIQFTEYPPMHNTNVTYICDPGYEVLGRSVRQCQNDGSWSGFTPLCGKFTLPLSNALLRNVPETGRTTTTTTNNECVRARANNKSQIDGNFVFSHNFSSIDHHYNSLPLSV